MTKKLRRQLTITLSWEVSEDDEVDNLGNSETDDCIAARAEEFVHTLSADYLVEALVSDVTDCED